MSRQTQEQTILIVDDNPANLGVIADYLEAYGYTILVARDGESGLDKVRYGQPDLILLDIMMPPGIDGFEVCRRLKAEEQTKEIPVIFMTALASTEDKVKGFQLGAVDYVTKPIQQEEMLARITTHLSIRRLAREFQEELIEREQAEVALRESEARTRLMIDSALDAVISIDVQGRIIAWNLQAEAMFGWTAKEAIGERLADTIIPSHYREAHERGLKHFLATGEGPILNQRIEIIALHREGYEFPIQLSITPLKAGNTITFNAFVQDISERKKLSAELEAKQQTLQAILDHIPMGVFVVEAPTGRPILTNQQSEVLLGRGIAPDATKDELTEIYAVYVYGSNEPYPTARLPVVRGMSGETVSVDDIEIRLPDNSRKQLEVQAVPIYDGFGNITASVAIFQDITERRRVEKVLRDTTELQTAILNNANYAIISTTPEGLITTFNPAAERLLGYTAEEMINKQTPAIFHDPKEVGQRAKIFSKELGLIIEPGFEVFVAKARQNLANEYEWTYIHKSDRRIPVLLSVTALREATGVITGFLGIANDITERKQTEIKLAKQATELATVSQISTTVSTMTEPQVMLQNVVDLTKENFNLYHAHIYLLNEVTNTLVLAAGAGEVGRKMVAEGWRIPLAREQSLVAQAARLRRGVIANDVRQNPDYLQNPDLPQTRAEMAVPLLVGQELLGILDVQAAELNRFTDEDVSIQTTLAAQIAVALQNARSFERSEQALRELNALTRRLTREGWEDYLTTQPTNQAYIYELGQSSIRADTPVAVEQMALTQPLTVQNEIIGHLSMVEPQALSEGLAEIMGAVAERLSAHLENLRLTEQTETALAETRALYEVGQALTTTANIEQGLEETLKILIKHRVVAPTTNLVLNTLEVDESGEPVWSELVTFLMADGSTSPLPPGTRFYLPDIPLTQIWQQNPGLLMFEDVRTDERLDQATTQLYLTAGSLSTVLMNMKLGGRWVGQLSLSWPEPQHFSERDERLFQALMGQVATVLDNRHLFAQTQAALQETEGQAYRLAVLNEIGTGLSLARNATEIFKVVVDNTTRLVGIDRASVALITPAGDKFEVLALEGEKGVIPTGTLLPLAGTSVGQAIREQHLVTIPDTRIAEYLDSQRLAEQGLLSTMNAPLVASGQVIGSLNVASRQPGAYSGRDENVLQQIASLLASTLENRRLFEQTQAAVQALRENEARLSEALTIARLGNWEFDVATQMFTFNDQFYALFHTTAEQEGGNLMPAMQYAQKFVYPDDAYVVGAEIQKALEATDPNYSQQLDHRIIRADGSEGYILVKFKIVKNAQGQTVKIYGANQDITERKQAELERERLLAEVEAAYRQYVRREWGQFLGEQHQAGWHIDHQETKLDDQEPTDEALNAVQSEVLKSGRTKIISNINGNKDKTQATLIAPIALRGEVIGTLSLQDLAPERRWTAEEIALVESVSEQLALTVENLRLFDDTQRRAGREQITREITDKMRAAPDMDAIIQTGLAELGKALGTARTYVKLNPHIEQD